MANRRYEVGTMWQHKKSKAIFRISYYDLPNQVTLDLLKGEHNAPVNELACGLGSAYYTSFIYSTCSLRTLFDQLTPETVKVLYGV